MNNLLHPAIKLLFCAISLISVLPVLADVRLGQSAGHLQAINFAYDSVEICPEELQKLQDVAAIILVNPDWIVVVEGHTDERGTGEYNLILGERMAQAVKAKLIEFGVIRERLRVFSYGEEQPLDSAHDEAAWERNRWVEFRVI